MEERLRRELARLDAQVLEQQVERVRILPVVDEDLSFGREPDQEGGFSWERTDLADKLKSALA